MRSSMLWTGVAGLAALTLVAAVMWPQSSPEQPAVGARAQADVWTDATPPPVPLPSDVDAVIRSKIWGGEVAAAKADAGTAVPPPLRWWLMAVYGVGAQRAVIVAQSGKSDMTLHPGDLLPSGDRIVDITPKGVCVLLNGQRRLLAVNEARPIVW